MRIVQGGTWTISVCRISASALSIASTPRQQLHKPKSREFSMSRSALLLLNVVSGAPIGDETSVNRKILEPSARSGVAALSAIYRLLPHRFGARTPALLVERSQRQ